MGHASSTIRPPEYVGHETKKNKVWVIYLLLSRNTDSTVSPEELNELLGENYPKYLYLEQLNYPYVFCVPSGQGKRLSSIIKSSGYKLMITLTGTAFKVSESRFNKDHCVEPLTYVTNETLLPWLRHFHLVPVKRY